MPKDMQSTINALNDHIDRQEVVINKLATELANTQKSYRAARADKIRLEYTLRKVTAKDA